MDCVGVCVKEWEDVNSDDFVNIMELVNTFVFVGLKQSDKLNSSEFENSKDVYKRQFHQCMMH